MVISDQSEYDHFKYVTVIQNWLKTQPHLPQNIRKFSKITKLLIYSFQLLMITIVSLIIRMTMPEFGN